LAAICDNAYDTSGGQSAPAAGFFRVPNLIGRVPLGYGTGFPLGGAKEITTVSGNDTPGYLVVNFIIKL
jgi:hypothetical protein